MKNNKTKEIFVPGKYIKDDGTILDFTGLYTVSNLGRVKSLNYNKTGEARELKQGTVEAKDGSIWYQVVLCKNGKKYPLPTHRLILSSFRPKGHHDGYSSGAVVNHKIERTATSCSNELSNLEWVTRQDNVSTDHCKETISKANTNHPSVSKQVRVTLHDGTLQYFPSAYEAERSLGIPCNTICHCMLKYNGYYKKRQLHFEHVM